MAALFTPYTWRGTQADIQLAGPNLSTTPSRISSYGVVENISLTTGQTQADAIYIAMQAVMAVFPVGTTYSANLSTYKFSRLIMNPTNDSTMAVQLVYETVPISGLSSYIVSDDAVTQGYQTNFVPGTRTPISCKFDDSANSGKNLIPQDSVTFNFDRAVRRISVTALMYGSNPPSYQSEVDKVNNAPWRGLGVGYWRVASFGTTLSRYDGYYNMQAVAISKQDEDWSYTGILRSSQTGKFALVSQADITTMNAMPYSKGIIYGDPAGTGAGKGIVRVGPYDLTSIGLIFGVS